MNQINFLIRLARHFVKWALLHHPAREKEMKKQQFRVIVVGSGAVSELSELADDFFPSSTITAQPMGCSFQAGEVGRHGRGVRLKNQYTRMAFDDCPGNWT